MNWLQQEDAEMSSGPQFFQTGLGRTFYEYHVPETMKAMKDIAKELKRSNDLKERELRLKEQMLDAKKSGETLDI